VAATGGRQILPRSGDVTMARERPQAPKSVFMAAVFDFLRIATPPLQNLISKPISNKMYVW
jgi:hypothetical protein